MLNRLSKYEKFFFLTIVLLNLVPLVMYRFFPTLDGPAHLYNANLIDYMLFHGDFDSFYQFNSEPVPNWTGHVLLCFFKSFLPGYLAEKMLLLIYFIGLPYAFRNFVKSINPGYIGLSYFIFPLTYNHLLSLGFYNFSLGMIGLFLILSFWVKNHHTIAGSVKKMGVLGLLLILTYFSHVLMFSISLLAIGCYVFISFLKELVETKKFKESFLPQFKKALALLVSALIPLVLMALYFSKRPDTTGFREFLPKQELIQWLNYLNPIICYNKEIEMAYTRKIIYILCGLVITGIIIRIIRRKSAANGEIRERFISLNDTWLFLAGIMLLLLFKMPDKNGMASIISMRFGLLFFLFLVTWIASMKYAKWFILVCSLTLLAIHFKRVRYLDSVIDIHNTVAVNCNKVEKHIKPKSTVVSLNFSNFWFKAHFSNYLGIDKPLIILENYEATMDYFPLLWSRNTVPNFQIGGVSVSENPLFESIPFNLENEKKEVDYVFVLGNWDSTNTNHVKALEMMSGHFIQTYKNEDCTLYRRKSMTD